MNGRHVNVTVLVQALVSDDSFRHVPGFASGSKNIKCRFRDTASLCSFVHERDARMYASVLSDSESEV